MKWTPCPGTNGRLRPDQVGVINGIRTEGGCREISVALAIALAPIDKPVCICSGNVTVGKNLHEHTWCRIENQIIDASADQFGLTDDVLFGFEDDYPQYKESQFLIFHPARVQSMLEEINPARTQGIAGTKFGNSSERAQ